MRRTDRALTTPDQLLGVVADCKICRIAMQDEEGLYLVPLNFGYQYQNPTLTLYFHSAKEGRKLAAFAKNQEICFEMDCAHSLIQAEGACGYGYAFQSIIGNGRGQLVTDATEKKQALTLLMKHQTGKDFTFDDKEAASVTVFKLVATSFTGKGC